MGIPVQSMVLVTHEEEYLEMAEFLNFYCPPVAMYLTIPPTTAAVFASFSAGTLSLSVLQLPCLLLSSLTQEFVVGLNF